MITKEVAWSSLMLSSVQARASLDSMLFPDKSVTETLLLNPALKDLTLTRSPRWVHRPTDIKLHSSVVLSFEDPDGAILQHLLKTWMTKKPRAPGNWGYCQSLATCYLYSLPDLFWPLCVDMLCAVAIATVCCASPCVFCLSQTLFRRFHPCVFVV